MGDQGDADELEARVEELDAALEEEYLRNEELNEKVAGLVDERQQLKLANEALRTASEEHAEEMARLKQEIRDLRSEKEKAKRELLGERAKATREAQKHRDAEVQRKQNRKEAADVEEENARLRNENEAMAQEKETLATHQDELIMAIQQLRTDIDTATNDLEVKEEELMATKEKMAELRAELHDARERLALYEDREANFDARFAAEQKKNQEKAETMARDLLEKDEKIRHLEEELLAVKQSTYVAEKEKELADTKRQLTTALQSLREHEAELVQSVEQNTQLQEQIRDYEQNLEQHVYVNMAEARQETHRAQQRNKTLESRLREYQERVEELEAQKDRLQEDLDLAEQLQDDIAGGDTNAIAKYQKRLRHDIRRRDEELAARAQRLGEAVDAREYLYETCLRLKQELGKPKDFEYDEHELREAALSDRARLEALVRELEKQLDDMEEDRLRLLKALRENAAQIGEKGLRFQGLTPEQLITVSTFAHNLRDGKVELPADPRTLELQRENKKLREQLRDGIRNDVLREIGGVKEAFEDALQTLSTRAAEASQQQQSRRASARSRTPGSARQVRDVSATPSPAPLQQQQKASPAQQPSPTPLTIDTEPPTTTAEGGDAHPASSVLSGTSKNSPATGVGAAGADISHTTAESEELHGEAIAEGSSSADQEDSRPASAAAGHAHVPEQRQEDDGDFSEDDEEMGGGDAEAIMAEVRKEMASLRNNLVEAVGAILEERHDDLTTSVTSTLRATAAQQHKQLQQQQRQQQQQPPSPAHSGSSSPYVPSSPAERLRSRHQGGNGQPPGSVSPSPSAQQHNAGLGALHDAEQAPGLEHTVVADSGEEVDISPQSVADGATAGDHQQQQQQQQHHAQGQAQGHGHGSRAGGRAHPTEQAPSVSVRGLRPPHARPGRRLVQQPAAQTPTHGTGMGIAESAGGAPMIDTAPDSSASQQQPHLQQHPSPNVAGAGAMSASARGIAMTPMHAAGPSSMGATSQAPMTLTRRMQHMRLPEEEWAEDKDTHAQLVACLEQLQAHDIELDNRAHLLADLESRLAQARAETTALENEKKEAEATAKQEVGALEAQVDKLQGDYEDAQIELHKTKELLANLQAAATSRASKSGGARWHGRGDGAAAASAAGAATALAAAAAASEDGVEVSPRPGDDGTGEEAKGDDDKDATQEISPEQHIANLMKQITRLTRKVTVFEVTEARLTRCNSSMEEQLHTEVQRRMALESNALDAEALSKERLTILEQDKLLSAARIERLQAQLDCSVPMEEHHAVQRQVASLRQEVFDLAHCAVVDTEKTTKLYTMAEDIRTVKRECAELKQVAEKHRVGYLQMEQQLEYQRQLTQRALDEAAGHVEEDTRSLISEAARYRGEAARLEMELAGSRKEVEQVGLLLKDLTKECEVYRDTMRALEENAAKAEQASGHARDELARVQATYDGGLTRDQHASLKQEMDELREKNLELEALRQRYQRQAESVSSQVLAFKRLQEDNSAEMTQLKKDMSSLEAEHDDNLLIGRLQRELLSTTTGYRAFARKHEATRTQLRERELALRLMEERLDNRETALLQLHEQRRDEVAALKDAMRQVASWDMSQADSGKVAMAVASGLKEKVEGVLETELPAASWFERVNRLAKRVTDLSDVMHEAATQAEAMEKERETMVENVETVTQESEMLRSQLVAMEEAVSDSGDERLPQLTKRFVALADELRRSKLEAAHAKRRAQAMHDEKLHLESLLVRREKQLKAVERAKVEAETTSLLAGAEPLSRLMGREISSSNVGGVVGGAGAAAVRAEQDGDAALRGKLVDAEKLEPPLSTLEDGAAAGGATPQLPPLMTHQPQQQQLQQQPASNVAGTSTDDGTLPSARSRGASAQALSPLSERQMQSAQIHMQEGASGSSTLPPNSGRSVENGGGVALAALSASAVRVASGSAASASASVGADSIGAGGASIRAMSQPSPRTALELNTDDGGGSQMDREMLQAQVADLQVQVKSLKAQLEAAETTIGQAGGIVNAAAVAGAAVTGSAAGVGTETEQDLRRQLEHQHRLQKTAKAIMEQKNRALERLRQQVEELRQPSAHVAPSAAAAEADRLLRETGEHSPADDSGRRGRSRRGRRGGSKAPTEPGITEGDEQLIARLDALTSHLEDVSGVLAEEETKNRELRLQLRTAHSQREKAEEKCEKMKKELKKQEADLITLAGELEEERTQHQQLKQDDSLSKKAASMQKLLRSRNSKIRALRQVIVQIKEEFIRVEENHALEKHRLESGRGGGDAGGMGADDGSLAGGGGGGRGGQPLSEDERAAFAELQSKFMDMEDGLAQAKRDLELARKHRSQFERTRKALKDENGSLAQELSKATDLASRREEEAFALRRQVEDAGRKESRLRDRLKQVIQDKKDLKRQLAETRAALSGSPTGSPGGAAEGKDGEPGDELSAAQEEAREKEVEERRAAAVAAARRAIAAQDALRAGGHPRGAGGAGVGTPATGPGSPDGPGEDATVGAGAAAATGTGEDDAQLQRLRQREHQHWATEKKLRRHIAVVEKRLGEKSRELEAANGQLDQTRNALRRVEAEKTSLASRLTSLGKDHQRLRQDSAQELGTLEDARSRVFELETENSKLRRKAEMEQVQELLRLRQANERLRHRQDETEALLEEAEKRVDAERRRAEGAYGVRDSEERFMREESLRDENRKLREEKEEAVDGVLERDAQIMELQFDLEGAHAEADRLRRRIRELQAAYRGLSGEEDGGGRSKRAAGRRGTQKTLSGGDAAADDDGADDMATPVSHRSGSTTSTAAGGAGGSASKKRPAGSRFERERDLENVVEAMRRVIDRLKGENARLRRGVSESSKVAEAQRAAKDANRRVHDLEEELESLRTRLADKQDVAQKLTQRQQQIGQLRQTVRARDDEIHAAELRMEQLGAERERLARELGQIKRRVQELEANATAPRQSTERLRGEASSLEAENERLRSTNARLERELEEARDQSSTAGADTANRIRELEDENAELQRELDVQIAGRDRGRGGRSTASSAEVSELRAENRRLKQENARLTEELRPFDQDFFDEIEDLKYKYSQAVRELAQYKRRDGSGSAGRGGAGGGGGGGGGGLRSRR